MNHFFIVFLAMSTGLSFASSESPTWLCHASLALEHKVEQTQNEVIHDEDHRIVAIENQEYALTIEVNRDKVDIKALKKGLEGVTILSAASGNRVREDQVSFILPVSNGIIRMGCEKEKNEGQSDKDRVAIKDIQQSRTPAVDSVYTKRIMRLSTQQ